MRKQSIFLISLVILAFCSCQVADNNSGIFKLLPVPQEMEITGSGKLMPTDILQCYGKDGVELPALGPYLLDIQNAKKPSGAQIIYALDPSMDMEDEAYTLEITKNKINITGKDEAGLLYAFMTLDQLMEDAVEQIVPLPLCRIRDYPELSYRAIQLDVKHHLEKTEYYYKLMNKLARYKINAVIVEFEDKLAYEGQPGVGSANALSIEEWKNLCEYAMERNIEISPLVQGLGHASFILKHNQYRELRDDPESDWAFNPLDPGTYDLQFDLYMDAIEATPHGKYLHVGGDEVHTTGRGSGKSPLELQLIWLNKVCKFAEDQNRIPIFWDDMPIKHAGLYRPMFNDSHTAGEIEQMWAENEHKLVEFLDLFPKNCIYMRWNYQVPQALGNIKAMEWFSDKGFQVMGATAGQTRWVLMPQNESNMDNIRSFTLTSIEKGLSGLLLTLWDDDSPHFELYMRGILAFAEYSWAGDKRDKAEIKSAYRQREFSFTLAGDEYAFVDQLEPLVGWWNGALLQRNSRVSLNKLDNPLEQGLIHLPDRNSKGTWTVKHKERLEKAESVLKECEDVASTIKKQKSRTVRNMYRLDVYEQVNNLVRFSAHILMTLQQYDLAQNEQEEDEAIKKVKGLSAEFNDLRSEFEEVYSQTRILTKPEDYILDQDHHNHLANQTITFDWQFVAELLFLKKVQEL